VPTIDIDRDAAHEAAQRELGKPMYPKASLTDRLADWIDELLYRLRAVARQLEETAVLDPVPGRTATELARDAGRAIPHLAPELNRAAEAFNDVTYGERPGTEAAYRMIADLDDHLRSRSSAAQAAYSVPTAADWAEVQ